MSNRWNIVSILVLLCQGLLFENTDSADEVVYAFGILIVLIVCFCLCLTLFSLMNSMLRPNHKRQILVYRRSGRKLPREMLLELYFLNSLIRLDYEREVEIDNNEFKSMMTKAEYEDTRASMEAVYKPLSNVGSSNSTDLDLVDGVLPEKPGGPITSSILEYQNRMLMEFLQSVNHH
jgi:hypothetical protein